MCGFGEKDRRPIDPPPIVQLHVFKEDGTPDTLSPTEIAMFVVHADLWSVDQTEPRNLVINPSSIPTPTPSTGPGGASSSVISLSDPSCTRNLMGSLISNAYNLTNPRSEQGVYFIFQDLSVRTEGKFSLKFSFANLGSRIPDVRDPSMLHSRTEGEVFTSPFMVYSAKKFPGMTESTELSKCFAKQGIKIPIRKDSRFRRGDHPFRNPSGNNGSSSRQEGDGGSGGGGSGSGSGGGAGEEEEEEETVED